VPLVLEPDGDPVTGEGPQALAQRVVQLAGPLAAQERHDLTPAVWSDDAATAGLGQVGLTALGNATTSTRVRDVASPGFR
jgi:hypothetical protein